MLARSGRWAAAGAFAGVGLATSPWAALAGPAEPRFRIGVCDWTIRKRADLGAFEVAKRIGVDGIQVDLGHQDQNLPVRDPALQKRYREVSKESGIALASIALGALNQVPYKSDPRAEKWVEESIDAASGLGVQVVLVPFFSDGDLRNDNAGKEVVIERFKRVASKAEKAGVVLGIESMLSAEEHMEIINRVGSKAVMVYYDVGNSTRAGYDIYKEIRWLAKQICEFHAKDYEGTVGQGVINFPEVRKAMDEIGFSGWIQLESVKLPQGVEETISSDLQYLRKVLT
jgi:sugar phosphate isomerase/epimerase